MFFSGLFAQGRPAGSPFERPEIIWASAGLAGALLVGAVVIYFVDRWRKRIALKDREAAEELSSFRTMYERGEITEAEYNRLRQKVADRVKKPAPAATPAGAAPANAAPAANPGTAGPAVTGPFPAGYFDDPPATPPLNGEPPPRPTGGNSPPS